MHANIALIAVMLMLSCIGKNSLGAILSGYVPMTFPIFGALAAVNLPAVIIAYLRRQPLVYLIAAVLNLIIAIVFTNIVIVVFLMLDVLFYFLTRGIYELKSQPEYPQFKEKEDR